MPAEEFRGSDGTADQPRRRPRLLGCALAGVIVASIVISLIAWFGQDYLDSAIRDEVNKQVTALNSEQTNARSLTVAYSALEFDVLGGWMSLSGIRIKSAAKVDSVASNPGPGPNPDSGSHTDSVNVAIGNDVFSVQIDSIHVNGISWFDLLSEAPITLQAVQIFRPQILGHVHTDDIFAAFKSNPHSSTDAAKQLAEFNDTSAESGLRIWINSPIRVWAKPDWATEPDLQDLAGQNPTEQSPQDAVSTTSVSVERLDLQQLTASVKHVSAGDTLEFIELEETGLSLQLLDVYTLPDGPLVLLEDVAFNAGAFLHQAPGSDYCMRADRIKLQAQAGEIELDSVRFALNIPQSEYFAKQPFRADVLDFAGERVTLSGVGFNELIAGEAATMASLRVEGARFDILSDKRKSINPHSTTPLMPSQALHAFPMLLMIDSIQVRNLWLRYGERQPGWSVPARLYWENLNADITSVDNMQSGRETLQFELAAAGRFMGEARMHIDMQMSTAHAGLCFEATGGLEAMALNNLNQFVSISELLRIDGGRNLGATFNLNVIDGVAGGTVDVRYRDLDISMLDKDDLEDGNLLTRFKGFLARSFVIRSENLPEDDGSIQLGKINYRLQADETFPSFLWKSVRSGLGELLGFG